jgi:hypothetical protein
VVRPELYFLNVDAFGILNLMYISEKFEGLMPIGVRMAVGGRASSSTRPQVGS